MRQACAKKLGEDWRGSGCVTDYQDGKYGDMRYRIFWEECGVLCMCADAFSDDYLAVNRQISSDSRFSSAEYLILDTRPVSIFTISASSIRAMAEVDGKTLTQNPCLKLASVVTLNSVPFGLTRMYQNYLEIFDERVSSRFSIFDRIDAARAWISLRDK